jgi:hypothetical protein
MALSWDKMILQIKSPKNRMGLGNTKIKCTWVEMEQFANQAQKN